MALALFLLSSQQAQRRRKRERAALLAYCLSLTRTAISVPSVGWLQTFRSIEDIDARRRYRVTIAQLIDLAHEMNLPEVMHTAERDAFSGLEVA